MKKIRLGSATSWSRDRFNLAGELVRDGNVDYLCFETMSEITMSAVHVNPTDIRYDPYLEERLRPILKDCTTKGIKIISNQGWGDPCGAAEKVVEIARSLEIPALKVAAVYDASKLNEKICDLNLSFRENGKKVEEYLDDIVSVDVYLGADGMVEALKNKADVVITGRIVDSALYLAPLAYEFNLDLNDVAAMSRGSVIGHMMECGNQVTGGYFLDPGYKDVPDPANLGAPIAEITEDHAYITKCPNTGGLVSVDTCKEQLLYEITRPDEYLLPNVTVDFSQVKFTQIDKDVVEITGFGGRDRPSTLKALIGLREGFATEEMVLFAGPSAMERARITENILKERFAKIGFTPKQLRVNYVGLNSIHREATPAWDFEPYEAILRFAVKTDDLESCGILRKEVDTLGVNGPAGTGKYGSMSGRIRPIVGMLSVLIDRSEIEEKISYFGYGADDRDIT